MTSILTKIENLLSGTTAKKIETYLVTLGTAELKIVATSPLGVAVLGAIKAGETGTTSAEKIELAIASLVPFLTTQSPGALVEDLETAARTIIEGVLARLKTTGPLAIFQMLISTIEAA